MWILIEAIIHHKIVKNSKHRFSCFDLSLAIAIIEPVIAPI